MKFNKMIPELSVSCIEQSKQFYLHLGFQIVYERPENKFCFLELEGSQIMIEENNEHWNTGELVYPYGRGMNLSIEVLDIEEIYAKVKEYKYPLFQEMMINCYRVNDEVYEDKEFLIQDPDGYLLRFTT